jgi:hypothetical protein
MLRSAETRYQAEFAFDQPICVYDLCARLNVVVRFNDISMEGMYDRMPRPRIHLSARRPHARRAFNCAHELGHHLFGHGSTIDELRTNASRPTYCDPREYVADAFASHLLMPVLAIGHAFAQRGWSLSEATRTQLFTIACHFGVGYATLVTHLVYGLGEIPTNRFEALSKPLVRIKREVLGYSEESRLIVVDDHWTAGTLDLEVGTLLWLPQGSIVSGDRVAEEYNLSGDRLFRGAKQGICEALLPNGRSVMLRVSRYQFVGLAEYRHLADPEEEHE